MALVDFEKEASFGVDWEKTMVMLKVVLMDC